MNQYKNELPTEKDKKLRWKYKIKIPWSTSPKSKIPKKTRHQKLTFLDGDHFNEIRDTILEWSNPACLAQDIAHVFYIYLFSRLRNRFSEKLPNEFGTLAGSCVRPSRATQQIFGQNFGGKIKKYYYQLTIFKLS